jgi:hypothetical protein
VTRIDHFDVAVQAITAEPQEDLRIRPARIDGVLDQVDQHLFERLCIAANQALSIGERHDGVVRIELRGNTVSD